LKCCRRRRSSIVGRHYYRGGRRRQGTNTGRESCDRYVRIPTIHGGGDNNNNLDRTTLINKINNNNNTIGGSEPQTRCKAEFRIDGANTPYACGDYIILFRYSDLFYDTEGETKDTEG